MNETKTKREFVWRGSQLSLDITTHEETDDVVQGSILTPCLQVVYRARIPLRGQTFAEQREHAKSISEVMKQGLSEMPTVDNLKLWIGRSLQDRPHQAPRKGQRS